MFSFLQFNFRENKFGLKGLLKTELPIKWHIGPFMDLEMLLVERQVILTVNYTIGPKRCSIVVAPFWAYYQPNFMIAEITFLYPCGNLK
jgi:hypothetical protein